MGNKIKGKIEENYEPTADEITKYGIWLGLTLPDDEDLLYIARKCLTDPLPHPWKRCKTRNGRIYYFNFKTGQSELQHPRGFHYRLWARDAKRLNLLNNIKPTSLPNYQMSTTNDLNSKLKEIANTLNIDTLRNKTAEILSRPNNSELEMDFRETCFAYQINYNLHDPSLMQAYKDYLNAYQIKTSLYIINWDEGEQGTRLKIYDTETETETKNSRILKTLEELDFTTCITQLPNGKLFCFGNTLYSGITMLIDVNREVEVLPWGTPCNCSSCIYFNNSVYCFGGIHNGSLTLSNRFDLDRKRWIQLTPMSFSGHGCSSIILNGNILISGFYNRYLFLYSIDIDSFSIIPIQLKICKKILINAERLYLIECGGSIYESEIESYTDWRRIAESAIKNHTEQVYYLYNKGGIYILCRAYKNYTYYKFDLKTKLINKL